MVQRQLKFFAAALFAIAFTTQAADAPKRSERADGKSTRMDEPMKGEMMKKGMKRSDVRKAAEKKARDMKPRMDQEKMPPSAPRSR